MAVSKKTAAQADSPVETMIKAGGQAASIHQKLIEVRRKIGHIEKSKTNTHLRYEYRTEDDYYNTIRPLLDEVGVMLYVSTTSAVAEGGYVYVTMKYLYVDAASGERVAVGAMGMGDLKDGTGVKKAQTGAARYHFQKMFLVADGEDDEADVGKPQVVPTITRATSAPAKVEETVSATLLGIRSDISKRNNRPYTYLAVDIPSMGSVPLRHIFKTGEMDLDQIFLAIGRDDLAGKYSSYDPAEFTVQPTCSITLNRSGSYPAIVAFTPPK
jgi:hypothetical protein